jgi:hypothetical protein
MNPIGHGHQKHNTEHKQAKTFRIHSEKDASAESSSLGTHDGNHPHFVRNTSQTTTFSNRNGNGTK